MVRVQLETRVRLETRNSNSTRFVNDQIGSTRNSSRGFKLELEKFGIRRLETRVQLEFTSSRDPYASDLQLDVKFMVELDSHPFGSSFPLAASPAIV